MGKSRYSVLRRNNTYNKSKDLIELINDLKAKNVLHIFIDTKELYDFLKNIVYNNLRQMYDLAMDLIYQEHLERGSLLYIIHHKYLNKNSHCIHVLPSKKDSYLEIFNYGLDEKDHFMLISGNNPAESKELNQKIERLLPEYPADLTVDNVYVLLGLFIYRNAFPDCIIDGTPEENKSFDKFYKAKNRFKLKTHESLIDRSGVTPHLRRGHFRRLTSDYYKNKKGQVVFIHSTMIKGRAKTVLDNKGATS